MKDKSVMKELISNLTKVVFIIATVVLVVYLITVVSGSEEYFRESAEKNALLNFESDLNLADSLADIHYQNLYEVAERVEYASSPQEVEEIISSYIGCDQFGDLRYYSQGQAYTANGVPVDVELSADAEIRALSQSRTEGCTGVYDDVMTKLNCMAFFVPVRGSAYVDGVLSIVPARNIIELDGSLLEKASLMVLIDESGRIFADTASADLDMTVGNNFYDFLDRLTSNKNDANQLAEAVLRGEKGVLSISFGSVEYTLAYSSVSKLGNHYYLVTMSTSEGLIAPELTYVRHIVNILNGNDRAAVLGSDQILRYRKATKERKQCDHKQIFAIKSGRFKTKRLTKPRFGQVHDHVTYDLAERKRHDRQIVTAKAQCRQTDDHTEQCRYGTTHQQRDQQNGNVACLCTKRLGQ